VEKHQIEAIAIGNGTASRETEAFIRKLGLPASDEDHRRVLAVLAHLRADAGPGLRATT